MDRTARLRSIVARAKTLPFYQPRLGYLAPETLLPARDGDKGELVVTNLTREAMPILRFRSGDLSIARREGGRLVLPRGIFGRTDTMVKVKGVKVYPKELLFLLAGTPGLNFRAYQLLVSCGPSGTDHAVLRVEGEATTDTRELKGRIRVALGIWLDIRVEPEVSGELVVDERF